MFQVYDHHEAHIQDGSADPVPSCHNAAVRGRIRAMYPWRNCSLCYSQAPQVNRAACAPILEFALPNAPLFLVAMHYRTAGCFRSLGQHNDTQECGRQKHPGEC